MSSIGFRRVREMRLNNEENVIFCEHKKLEIIIPAFIFFTGRGVGNTFSLLCTSLHTRTHLPRLSLEFLAQRAMDDMIRSRDRELLQC